VVEGERTHQEGLELEHGKLPDPVARTIGQLVDKLNQINIRIAEVEERQDCVEDKIGMSHNGAAASESVEVSAEDPASKEKH
jgi:hypothetical protein